VNRRNYYYGFGLLVLQPKSRNYIEICNNRKPSSEMINIENTNV